MSPCTENKINYWKCLDDKYCQYKSYNYVMNKIMLIGFNHKATYTHKPNVLCHTWQIYDISTNLKDSFYCTVTLWQNLTHYIKFQNRIKIKENKTTNTLFLTGKAEGWFYRFAFVSSKEIFFKDLWGRKSGQAQYEPSSHLPSPQSHSN